MGWALIACIGIVVLALVLKTKSKRPGPHADGVTRRQSTGRPDARYWELLEGIQDAKSKHDYGRMLACCEESLAHIPMMVSETKRQFAQYDIVSIPAIETGCVYWGAMRNHETLLEAQRVMASVPELSSKIALVQQCLADEVLSRRMCEFLTLNPGYLQNKLPKALGVSGRDTSRIIRCLANVGQIRRTKTGKTYALSLSGSA